MTAAKITPPVNEKNSTPSLNHHKTCLVFNHFFDIEVECCMPNKSAQKVHAASSRQHALAKLRCSQTCRCLTWYTRSMTHAAWRVGVAWKTEDWLPDQVVTDPTRVITSPLQHRTQVLRLMLHSSTGSTLKHTTLTSTTGTVKFGAKQHSTPLQVPHCQSAQHRVVTATNQPATGRASHIHDMPWAG